ncbi:MAG: PspC domain-containing protein [Rhabdochlamydiaceae bacterium]|nr:PspC domain-containing protein [Candidatus Amphrikana amoebophyrae]
MKRLYRCRWDRKISGVCGGLGQYINVDPSILRLVTLILIPFTGFIIIPIVYLIASLVIPEGPKAYIQPKFKRLTKSSSDRIFSGICGGIGKFLRVNSHIVRAACVVGCFISFGTLVLIYIAAIFILPIEK